MKEIIGEIGKRYSIDQRELGKILIIASTSVFIVSLLGITSISDSVEEVSQANQDLKDTKAIMNGDRFQQSMEALTSIESTDVGQQFHTTLEAFRSAEESIENVESAEETLDDAYNTYQWMLLFSIMGAVAGVAVLRL